jgi:hypothetical protein
VKYRPYQLTRLVVLFAGAPAFFLASHMLKAADSMPDTPVSTNESTEGFEIGTGSAWRFVPQLSVVATYDDNLFISPTNKVSDTYLQVAPSLAVGLGDFRGQVSTFAPIPHILAQTGEEDLVRTNFLYLNYTPDIEEFFHQHRQDTVNQDVRVAGQEEGERWRLVGSLHYQDVTDPNIYFGGRTKQIYYNANLDGSYQFTGKLNGGLHLEGDRSLIEGGTRQQQGIATGYVDFQATGKTALGLGLALGDLQISPQTDQTYLQTLLRYRYQATQKIWLTGDVGPEFRHLGQSAGGRTGLVFDLNGEYQATEGTSFELGARRATVGAVQYRGVDIWESVYHAGVRQRVGNGFIATGTVGLVWDQYYPFTHVPLQRLDKFYYVKAAIGHDVTRHGTVQLSYEHRDDNSSFRQYTFEENLISVNLSFLF